MGFTTNGTIDINGQKINLKDYPLLQGIDLPEDLRQLRRGQLRQVSAEVRQFMIDVICRVGGHFGAGLGNRQSRKVSAQ